MTAILAFLRIDMLTATSYRMATVFRLVSILVYAVPIYYVAGALQPLMADSIQNEGGEYFAFILLGMVAYNFVTAGVSSVPQVLGGSIRGGSFEALRSTPTSLPAILVGMMGYGFTWMALRSVVLILAGLVFGVRFVVPNAPAAMLILLLIGLAYLPFGLLGGAMILAFRTTGPLVSAVIAASALLGGIYYPTRVIPDWLQNASALVPLTYGARALRRMALDGATFAEVADDLVVLGSFAAIGLTVSILIFHWSLAYAKRSGTLAQY